MRANKRSLLYAVLNSTYGFNAQKVKHALLTGDMSELETKWPSLDRLHGSVATLIASRCSNYQQALKTVEEWARS